MRSVALLMAAFVVGCTRPSPSAVAGDSGSVAPAGTSTDSGATVGRGMMHAGMGHGMGRGMGSMSMMQTAPADTSAAPAPRAVQTAQAADCPPITQKVVNDGRSIFSGTGNCYACHGANARGTPMAPNLTDKQWLNIDGSYASIVGLVHSGVPAPKQHPAPMPAMGGASLSSAQLCAVAAYVYSLSHS